MFKMESFTINLVLVSTFVFISSSLYGANALYPYKLLDNSSHLATLTPEEWTSEYSCQLDQGRNDTRFKHRPRDCYRESTAWRFNYVMELDKGPFRLLVQEGSIDERMANMIYTVSSNAGANFHSYTFNSGDHEQDLRNERLVAGPQVDDAKCVRHLNEMISLLEEIQSRISLKRNETKIYSEDEKLDLDLKEQHFRLARALDSFGRFESGTLGGRYHAMGIYRQCISTPMQFSDALIPSRYCWAQMSLDKHLNPALKRRSRFSQEGDNFQMMVAICLPESCHSKSFNPQQAASGAQVRQARERLQKLIDTQYKLPESIYYERTLELESVFCLVDENSKWAKFPIGGKLFLAIVGAWLTLMILATHRRRRKHQLDNNHLELSADNASIMMKNRSLLNKLDIFESWVDFIDARYVPRQGRVELDVLNPIKVLGSLGVVLVHSAIVLGPLSREPLAGIAGADSSRFELLIMTAFVVVDTFFVVSGILMTFIVLKKLARQRQRQSTWLRQQQARLTGGVKNSQEAEGQDVAAPRTNGKLGTSEKEPILFGLEFFKSWFYVWLYRYIRIVPLFFLVFWFKKTVFNHLGSGPLWDWALNKDTPNGACRTESWMTPLSFNSAFLPLGKQCLPPTWSLSNDLFFSFFMPPLIILFFKRPRITKYLMGVLIVAGFAVSMFAYYSIDYFYRFEIEQIHMHGVMILLTVASELYTHPIYRFPAMLIGIVAGYALFRYEQRTSNRVVLCEQHEWSWWFRKVATPTAVIFLSIATTLSVFLLDIRNALGPERTAWLVPLSMVSYHVTWSISNAILLLRMMTDWKDTFIMQMCAGRFWRVFAKLTYAALLIHWDLLTYEASTRTSQVVFSRSAYFSSFALAYFWTIFISTFLHVMVENPIDKLVKSYVLKA